MDLGLPMVVSSLELEGFRGVEAAVGAPKISDLSRTVKLAGVLGTGLISC